MSVHTADSRFSFQLPSLSYIDASWEEPNLRVSNAPQATVRKNGLASWLSRKAAAFMAWRHENQAVAELAGMSDRELTDIGLSRSDLGRVFTSAFSVDLQQRGG